MAGLSQLIKAPIDAAKSMFGKLKGKLSKDEEAEKYPDAVSDPDIDMDEASAWASTTFNQLKTAFTVYHRSIWEAILFYVGETWLTWDTKYNYFEVAEAEDEYTPMPKINRFAPAIDAVCSNFNTIPPIECAARDADGDEQYRRHGIAEIANRLAKDLILRTGLKSDFQSKDDKPSEAAQLYVLSGTIGTYVQARDMEPKQSELFGTVVEKSVEIDIASSLGILPRPGNTAISGLSGSPYLFYSRRMHTQECYNRFRVNAEADREFLDGYNAQFKSNLDHYFAGFNNTLLEGQDSALVTEVFVPPASPHNSGLREFAELGLYGVYVNGALKYAEKWQFPDHPITKIDYLRIPTQFFGRSVAFDLVPLQIEAQEYDSLIKLHGMVNSSTPWVADANTLVSEITGRGDRVIKYRSIGPNSPAPKREQAGSLDSGIYARVKYIDDQFQNISGAASVFRGRQEGSVVAASAIAQLRGQAEQMFSRPVLNWNNGWKETVRKGVLYMQKCYTLPQIMAICGSELSDAVQDFISCDLDQCVEWLAAANGLPRTQDEMRQEMLELHEKGALDMSDPNVKERLFRLFGETGMLTQFNLDSSRARMENKMMKAGRPPVFRPAIEDLQVHYTLHVEAVKSLVFDRYSPQVQELFLAHIMETKAAMAPPPPTPEADNLSFTGKLEDMPAPLVDAILEKHGIAPAPAVALPPDHSLGKGGPPPPPQHPGTATRGGPQPRSGHDATAHPGTSGLPSQGKPHAGSTVAGQGIQPIGASQGAPPAAPHPPQ